MLKTAAVSLWKCWITCCGHLFILKNWIQFSSKGKTPKTLHNMVHVCVLIKIYFASLFLSGLLRSFRLVLLLID